MLVMVEVHAVGGDIRNIRLRYLRQFQGLLGEGQTNSVLFGILLGFCVVKIKSSDTFRLRIVDFYNVFRLVAPTYP